MQYFKLPLSGDVSQVINPFTFYFQPQGGQYGFMNVNLGQSRDPSLEADILQEVGSYGRQLGRITDVLQVIVKHLPKEKLTETEAEAVLEFEAMALEITKLRRRRPASSHKAPS